LKEKGEDMKNQINIGVIGLGNIGSNMLSELMKQAPGFEKETGLSLKIAKTCDVDEKRKTFFPFTTHASDIIEDKNIGYIVELIGGEHPAYEFIKGALERGKHVFTANKLVISKYGKELEEIAKRNRCCLRFNAAVGGGMGLIDKLVSHEGNATHTIIGILNGTTNYILTKMHEGFDYEDALKEAQQKGFAEANPEFDVSGKDAAQKLAILISINFKTFVEYDKIDCEGIQDIKKEDIDFAKDNGYVIKLIAFAKEYDGGIEAWVKPVMLSKHHPIASVNNEKNVLYMIGNASIKIEGEGAGKPTVASIISDIKNVSKGNKEVTFFGDKHFKFKPMEEIESRFYLKFYGLNSPGTLYSLAGTLSGENINIESALQKAITNEKFVPMFFTTSKTKYSSIKKVMKKIDKKKLKEGIAMMMVDF